MISSIDLFLRRRGVDWIAVEDVDWPRGGADVPEGAAVDCVGAAAGVAGFCPKRLPAPELAGAAVADGIDVTGVCPNRLGPEEEAVVVAGALEADEEGAGWGC